MWVLYLAWLNLVQQLTFFNYTDYLKNKSMDFFNHKRNYRFKGGNNGNENKLFWIIGILLTLFFLLIYYYRK